MPLRFRSFVPYTLPGVLSLIGWWWYTSRKKARITSHKSEEGHAMGLLASPSEGSNGMVDKGCPAASVTHDRSCQDRPKAKEQRPVEQEVISQVHVPATETSVEEPVCSAVTVTTSRKLGAPPCSNATTDSHQASTESIRQTTPLSTSTPSNVVEKCFQYNQPGAAAVSSESSHLPTEEALGSAMQPQDQTTDKRESDSKKVKPAVVSSCVKLAKAERPEPEGEVAGNILAVPFAENVQVDLVKDSLSCTKDDLSSTTTAATRTVGPESPMVSVSFPLSASTPISDASIEPHHHENGGVSRPAETRDNMEELQRLAAGLITEVISAAKQEVMAVSSCKTSEAASSSTPTFNGKGTTGDEDLHVSHVEAPSQSHTDDIQQQAAQIVKEVINGCLSPSVWQKPEEVPECLVSSRGQLESTPVLPKLQGEETITATEDSGCSTCQSEDGISSEDLLLSTGLSSAVPESKEDLIQISGISRCSEEKEDGLQESSDLTELEEPTLTREHVAAVCEAARLNGTGFRNGTSEAEADQSGGSDVNSMDSVDSFSTLGAGDGQLSGSQASPSQSSELIVWEIEVPKHLVGRLIGKQGRYVSFLKQSSGAKIYISTLPYTQEFQICHIEGTQQQVDKALALIGKKFKDLDLTNLYAPPPLPLSLPSLPMTSWLLLPNGVTVEVIVVNIVSAGHVFVQQHTHPTYHALRSLDQQMFLCYSQPGTPALPSPAEVGVICAAPAVDGAWWRAQVISFYKDSNEVEIRYVDYGGYDRVKSDTLRQIRSDFVTLPFQGTEVLLDNVAPLPGEDRFSSEASSALEEMTRGIPLLAQVTNYDNNTGLPLVQMWNMVGEELVLLNRTLAERGFATWVDSF
ncbi:A-kinase anchor protein 1, mitochondrial [Astyanax mexicanus]|uniref:A-kinase anchor protein 1, mitochondrial n=1 Tax=Astyanax mexicanus TaxID=7994 RepID=A0A8T2L0L1_ASTMX|nr:A-kinase anchor protein 1, mitochondrial [Astyanax mexicanus]